MSIHTDTRPVSGSAMFNAWQLLCSQLIPVVNYHPSKVTGFAPSADSVPVEQKPMGFFKRLAQRIERKEIARQDAYLAESTDISDLERRMKQIECQRYPNDSQFGRNS